MSNIKKNELSTELPGVAQEAHWAAIAGDILSAVSRLADLNFRYVLDVQSRAFAAGKQLLALKSPQEIFSFEMKEFNSASSDFIGYMKNFCEASRCLPRKMIGPVRGLSDMKKSNSKENNSIAADIDVPEKDALIDHAFKNMNQGYKQWVEMANNFTKMMDSGQKVH